MSETETATFLRAVGDGEREMVRDMLAANPDLANAVGPHPYWGGRPQALHVAIETKRRDMFDLLLNAGAEPSGRNGEYDLWSPLMLAVHGGQSEMREALISRGALIGLPEALLMKDDAAVAILLEQRGLPPIAPNHGSILAFARTARAIDLLLAYGASLDRKDHWGTAPIEAMSRAGEDGGSLVQHMMRKGVVPDPEAFARLGDKAMLAALAESDPALPRRDAVLLAAVGARQHELVRWLLSMGASADARRTDLSRQTAVHDAAWNGDLAMVQLLAGQGADLRARDGEHDNSPRGWAETAARITNNPACMDVAAWLGANGG